MKILMISTDRVLLGERISTGDAIKRHQDYATHVEKLDIIIFTRPGYLTKQLSNNLFCYPTNSKFRFLYIFNAFRIARQLYRSQIKNYDIVVTQDPFLTGLVGFLIKRQFKAKLLIHFHGDFWQNKYWLKESFLNYIFLLISYFTVKHADAIRVVSSGIQHKLVQAGVTRKKIKIINTPVNLSQFSSPDNQTVQSIQHQFKGKKIILWVGRLSQEKNLPFLFDIFKQVLKKYTDTVLLLIGQGKELENLEKIISSQGLSHSIKLIGHLSYTELVNYYSAATMIVLPSLHESFGKVLLEAAATAKPAIASSTTGAKSIIQDKKTGFLVPINNHKIFVRKIVQLLKNQKLARHMGTQAYIMVQEKFSYKGNIKQVIDYWENIVMNLQVKKNKI